ncbi:MAG: hypothetical protein IJL26_02845, partial [Clostridia bacterium]|nr:hypothetical protein [Clostridia bacterium]
MKKSVIRISSVLLSLLLLLSLFPAQVFAAGQRAADGKRALEAYTLEPSADGFGVYLVDENGERVTDAPPASRSGGKRSPAASLPTQYDARDDGLVTSVKNQNPAGICWAFSTLGALETSAVKQELADVDAIDLAESHFANFAQNTLTTDPNDRTYGDGVSMNAHEIFDTGSNYFRATAALARGAGAADEADYPFDRTNYEVLYPESDRYVSTMHISDSSLIDCYEEQDPEALRDAVKQAVLDCGGVTVAYHSTESCYNVATVDGVRTSAYFENATTESNHMVMVVGWDDGYSVARFAEGNRPSAPGAWLCKNSWGASSSRTVNGYFYISYEESSLHEFNALTAAPADAFDHIYQYDGIGYKTHWGYTADYNADPSPITANVFTADRDEYVTSLGFWTSRSDTQYTLFLYTDLTDPADPTSGTLAAKISGTQSYKGYHTVPVPGAVRLDAGETFSVGAYMYRDGRVVFNTESIASDGYASRAGQSFYYNGVQWKDTHTYNNEQMNNVALKVMTADDFAHTHVAGETVYENESPGTCVLPGGRDEVTYCTVCGEELSREHVDTGTVPTNHVDTETVGETPSTCIAHGHTAGVYCRDCGQYVSGHAEKPFAEHTWDGGVPQQTATCAAGGSVLYTCTVAGCGGTKTVPTDPNPANHTGGTRTETENAVPGTCSAAGSYDEAVYCVGCGAELSRTRHETGADPDVHGHTHLENAADATCGEPGYTGDVFCDDCGNLIETGMVIPATGEHAWDGGVVTTAATTTEEGVKTFTCTVCGATRTEAIPKALAKLAVNAENAKTGIKLTWAQDENATGYYVYRKTASTSYKAIKKISSNGTVTYTDTTAEPGTKYTYCVKSYRGTERGACTAKTITCLAAITPTLANGKTGMTLTWTKAEGADGYYVFRKTGTGSYTTLKKIADPDTLTYTDTTAVSGTKYTYGVRAYKSITKGAYTAK